MLQGGRAFRAQPFNYRKLCYEVAGLLWLLVWVTGLVLIVSQRFVMAWVLWVGGLVAIEALVRFALTGGWGRLSAELRAELPYDASEAQKGSIHSHDELWRWIRQRRS
jgi:hypothetical protein